MISALKLVCTQMYEKKQKTFMVLQFNATCDWRTMASMVDLMELIDLNTYKIYYCENHLNGEEWR